jgi:hypothetical protein
MTRSRSRKLRQSPRTSAAVHAIRCIRAEPKPSTPFTYLQFHAQVVHSIPFKAYFSPGEPRYFSAVEWAHPVAIQVPVPLPRSSCRPRRYCALHSSVVALVQCSTLGKIKLHLLHPWSQMQPLSSIHLHCISFFWFWFHNGKSVGYSFRQKWCQHLSFLRQPCSLNRQKSVLYA